MTTVNLAPNANGDYEHIPINGGGGSPDHFTAIDDTPPNNDGDTTRLQTFNVAAHADVYNIAPASAVIPANAIINSVKVFYAFCNYDGTGGRVAYARPRLRLDSLEVLGAVESSSTVYQPAGYSWFNQTIARPGALVFSIDDLDALQVGVAIRTDAEGLSYSFFSAVYVQVDYTTSAGIPIGSTTPASDIRITRAKLNGVVTEDGGLACTCSFQYGLTRMTYGSTTGTQSKTKGQAFSVQLSGLTPNTTYHFRTVVTNANGTVYGPDQSFITLPDISSGSLTLAIGMDTVNANFVLPHSGYFVDGDTELVPWYTKVLTDDGDTTYITWYESTTQKIHRFHVQDLGGLVSFTGLSVTFRVRREAQFPGLSGQANGAVGLYTHGTVYKTNYSTISDGMYEDVSYAIANVNPFTVLPWTLQELNDLQIYMQFDPVNYSAANGGFTSPRITQAYVILTSVTSGFPHAVEIAVNQALMTVAPTWTDISIDLKRYHMLVGRTHELDRIETGKAEILLDNHSGDYWRGNTAGPYTPNMKPVTLVRISETYGATTYRLFYGYIEGVFHSWVDKEGGMIPQTEFTCVDMFKAFARMNVYPLTGTAGTHTYVVALASNANSGQKLVVLTSVEGLFAGQSVTIADDTPDMELNYIDTIDAATNTVTMLNNLVNNYTTGANGYVKKYPSVVSSQRLKDILYEKGFPAALTAIDTGLVTVAAMIDAPTGTNVLEHIHDVARAESGLAFMRGDGFFVFQNRDARQTGDYATSAATLKDDGDTHYVLPELADDDSLIYNTARVTPDNGNGETQEYFDSTMRDLHGERLWKDENSLIASVGDAIEKALIVVERYKDSILRCSRVELIPANNAADLYPKIFGLGLSRRITLQLDSTQNPALIDTQYHIEGIELTREVGALYKAFWQLWDVKKLLVAPTSYDGYLQKESLVSFADGHDAANADTAYNDAGLVAVGMQKDGVADWLFWRGFLKFDISAIPTSKTVLDAIVLVRLNGYFIIDDEFDLTLVDGATLANPIIVNDYGDMIGATTDFGSVTIPTPAINAARWVGIRLTAAGLADLQTHITAGTGFQKFGVRTSLDITNTAPGGTTNQQYVIFDGKGSDNPARLIVRVA